MYIKKGCAEAKNCKDSWKSVGPMLSGKSKSLDVNIPLVEKGDIVTGPQIVSNVFNEYYANITAGIGEPDSTEASQTISDITEVYNNHESVSYMPVRNNCRAQSVMSFTKFFFLTMSENDEWH